MRFRVFNKEFNKIVGSEEYVLGDNGTVFFKDIVNNLLVECSDKVIIQESTNLKDRKGIEIFDGDLVKDNDGSIGKIFWSDNAISLGEETNVGCFNLIGWAVQFETMKDYPILLSNKHGQSSSELLEVIN